MNELVKDSLADFTTDTRVVLLSLMALVIGAISALVAKALLWLIALITNIAYFQRFTADGSVTPQGHHLGAWSILVPMIGALVIGLMARYGSPKIRGHGIPEALEAILIGRSRIEPKVALLKPISSAISIGTGGPFGAEGPIIMTGGALGSLFAQLFHLTSAERKTLLVSGAAAGMAAVFATPLAAVLLAVELLLFEWKPRSFIPVAIASTVGGLLRVPLLGSGPIFAVTPHAPLSFELMGFAFVVGILAGISSGGLTLLVYAFEDLFHKLPIHWMWWPVIGGLCVGLGGWFDPRVLGVGYSLIHGLLRGEILGGAVLGLLFGKGMVWAVALGSGTSGGVLAPLLIIGGALGAFVGQFIPGGDPGLWAMVGMSAIMGGTMRSPLTSTVFALELTHDLNVLPGIFLASVGAVAVTVLLLRRSILTEKVARRGYHVIREYSVDVYELMRVQEVMDPVAPAISSELTVAQLSDMIGRGDGLISRRHGTLIFDSANRLAGIITRGDIMHALLKDPAGNIPVLDAGKRNPIVTHPDELLHQAVAKMLKNGIGRLPVVDRSNPAKVVGYLGRAEVMAARLRRFEEEEHRERGVTRAKAA